jgi:transcriptional regulator with XRE-family HTH domain
MTGTEIRRLRKRLGLTQQALADLLGVTNVTVSYWENDVHDIREPTARLLRLLAERVALPRPPIRHRKTRVVRRKT